MASQKKAAVHTVATYGTAPKPRVKPAESATQEPLIKVHAALAFSFACFGGGAFVSKFAIHGGDPIVFELVREVITAPILIAMALATSCRLLPDRADFYNVALSGMTFFMNQMCFFLALKHSDPVLGTTWQTSLPIFTTALAVATGHERAAAKTILGILIASGGAAFMTLGDYTGASGGTVSPLWSRLSGHGLYLLQTASISTNIVVSKTLTTKYSALAVSGWNFSMGAVVHAVVLATIRRYVPVHSFLCFNVDKDVMAACMTSSIGVTKAMALPLAYEVLLCSVSAWFLIAWATKHAKASVCSVYTVMQPCTSTALSALLVSLNGRQWAMHYGISLPGFHHLIGLVLIGAGLYLMLRNERESKDSNANAKESSV